MCSPDVGGFEDPSAMAADVNGRLQYDSPLLRTQIVGGISHAFTCSACESVACRRSSCTYQIVASRDDSFFAWDAGSVTADTPCSLSVVSTDLLSCHQPNPDRKGGDCYHGRYSRYSMIGEILDAKYRIDKQLGAGGMGNVYLATHLGTTRVVAVKVIAPKWAEEPQFLARFQREAQACGRLRHPNIVNVTDFGIAKAAGGDMPYLVMEFLDGQTLSDFHKDNPVVPLPVVADLLDQIGLALTEAHRHGIIHRDLKPDNIWMEPNGRGGYTVKVLDFGVAKVNLLGDWVPPVQETPPLVNSAAVTHGDELETVAILAPAPAASIKVRTQSD